MTLFFWSRETLDQFCRTPPPRLQRLDLHMVNFDMGPEHAEVISSLGKAFAGLKELKRLSVTLSADVNFTPREFPRQLRDVVWHFPSLEQLSFEAPEEGAIEEDGTAIVDIPVVKAPKLISYSVAKTICADTVVASCVYSPQLRELEVTIAEDFEAESDAALKKLTRAVRAGALPQLKAAKWNGEDVEFD